MKLRKLAEICNYFDGIIGDVEIYSAEDNQLYFELPEALRFTAHDLNHMSDKYDLCAEKLEGEDGYVRVFALYV